MQDLSHCPVCKLPLIKDNDAFMCPIKNLNWYGKNYAHYYEFNDAFEVAFKEYFVHSNFIKNESMLFIRDKTDNVYPKSTRLQIPFISNSSEITEEKIELLLMYL